MTLRVPLIAGASRRVVSQNIAVLRRTGVSAKAAVRAAYLEAEKAGGYRPRTSVKRKTAAYLEAERAGGYPGGFQRRKVRKKR